MNSKDNKPVSPYADVQPSVGFLRGLDAIVEIADEKRKQARGRKAVEALNQAMTWITSYRRSMAHSLTTWAATERANSDTGILADYDAICAVIRTGGVM